MFNTTAEFKEEIKKPSRSFECRITIGDLIFTNEDIVDIKLDGNIQPSEGFIIGATTSTTLDLVLLNSEDHIYSTNQIKVEIGLKIGSKIEYILMGYYNIDDIEKTDYTTKFTAYDNMIKFETPYFSKLGDTATLQQIINELAAITGVEFTGSLPAYNLKKLEGFTCREILSFVASLCGGNALITRDGKFTIVYPREIDYSLTTDNFFEYKKEEVPYKVGKVSCQVGEEILSKGSLGTDSMELEFENPWITESILTDIYNKLKDFNYLGYSMKWQGDISLDIGDIITVTDTKGVVRKLPILSQKFTYTGGLTSEIEAKGETKNKNSFSSSGSTANKVNRVVTELLIVNEALINKANIQDLQATNAEIQNLKASNAEIENALIKFATIEQLNATNANIQNLIAEDARINNLIANKADITELNAISGKITVLESEVGKIGVLESNVANIQDLINGNLSSENIQAGAITGDRLNMDTIFVKDANMINVNISALKSGDISTNKFRIVSDDGGIEIVGATQQFKDKNNKVRIQMGKDTQGNFNFILRGEDGTTTLIDHNGIKEKAIADNLIKENMVAPDTIGEKSINYNSFATGFNKDTNTSTIKGTKVRLDNQNQTLEVAFTSLKNQADGTKTQTESNTTQISIQQGKISTLIADTSIVKDGETIKLKDDYNSTVATVNSMKNTINSHETKINSNTGKITGVESKTNVLERDLNSMSSKLTSTEQIANSANNKIDNLEIGTNNLLRDTKDYDNPSKWTNKHGTIVFLNERYKGFKVLNGKSEWARWTQHINCEQSKKYVLSGYVKAGNNTTRIGSFVDGGRVEQFIGFNNGEILGTEWKRVAIVIHANEETLIPRFEGYRAEDGSLVDFYTCGWKFEKGTKASDWSINPEDLEEKIGFNKDNITKVNTEITITKNKVSTIEQNMDSITQRVGSVETITTSHTASLNAVDGKINTAKTQAINSAATDATNKSNKALSDAKSFTNGEISKVNTTMNSKFAEIKTTTDAINLQVSDTKKEVEKVNLKVDNVKVGIRNLIPDTDFSKDKKSKYKAWGSATIIEYSKEPTLSGIKRPSQLYVRNTKPTEDNGAFGLVTPKIIGGLIAGKEYTLSFKALSRGNTSHLNYMYIISNETGVANEIFVSEGNKVEINPYNKADKISYITFKPKKDYPNASILIARTDKIVASTTFNAFGIWDIILTEGNKVTDWVAAPEEINQEILDVTTTKISDAKAEIKLTTDSIKQSVSNVESSTATLNGKITAHESRLSSAEQKITTSAIVSTVTSSTTYRNDLSGKVSTNQIISSINQTAESIKIKANKLELDGATTIKDSSGRYVKIENGNYSFYKNSTRVGYLGFNPNLTGDVHPKITLGASGISQNDDYFTLNVNPVGGGEQEKNMTYADLAYRCSSKMSGDYSNMKMYGDGSIRLAPLKQLDICTAYDGGVYKQGWERVMASFHDDDFYGYRNVLDIDCIRNTRNGRGLVLTDWQHGINNYTCVRVSTDETGGGHYFRPLNGNADIQLGSGSFKWKKVYSAAGVAYSASSEPLARTYNNDPYLDTVIDTLDFTVPIEAYRIHDTKNRQLELNVSSLQNHVLSNLFIHRDYDVNEHGEKIAEDSVDLTSLLHLALYEIQNLKREIKILKGGN